jgi:hypothetical protein
MKAITTFFNGALFLLACLAGYLVFPALLICGGIALFTYAVIAELAESLFGAKVAIPDHNTARKIADRLSRF